MPYACIGGQRSLMAKAKVNITADFLSHYLKLNICIINIKVDDMVSCPFWVLFLKE